LIFICFAFLLNNKGDVHIVANQIKGDLQGKIVNLIAAGQEFSLAVAENGNELVNIFVLD